MPCQPSPGACTSLLPATVPGTATAAARTRAPKRRFTRSSSAATASRTRPWSRSCGRTVAAILGLTLALPAGEPVRLGLRPAATQLGAGVLFGIGDLTLLGLVTRVGTGTGFTIAQLSLLVNASIGIWAFHVPKPGTPQARRVLAGILIAGAGGCVIGAMR